MLLVCVCLITAKILKLDVIIWPWPTSGKNRWTFGCDSVPDSVNFPLPLYTLGVYIDADMSMRTHVTAVVKACFAALRQIRSVRRSLSRHALLTFVRALIVSKVEWTTATRFLLVSPASCKTGCSPYWIPPPVWFSQRTKNLSQLNEQT